jgi:N-acetylmuramic acid 6-phosphate etherase
LLVMIRLGRVHQGLMVDVRAINAKLQRRSEHMLLRLTGRDPCAALEQAGSSVKLAVLSRHACGMQDATRALERAGGWLLTALKDLGSGTGASDDLTIGEELPDPKD